MDTKSIASEVDYLMMIAPGTAQEKIQAGKNLMAKILRGGDPQYHDETRWNLEWLRDNAATHAEVKMEIKCQLLKNETMTNLLHRSEYDVLIAKLEKHYDLDNLIALASGNEIATESINSRETLVPKTKANEKITYSIRFTTIPKDVSEKAAGIIRQVAEKGIYSCFQDYVQGTVKEEILTRFIGIIFENHEKVGEEAVAKARVATEQLKIIREQTAAMPREITHGFHPFKKRARYNAEEALFAKKLAAVAQVGRAAQTVR